MRGNDYEDALVDRIAVREAAAALTPRQRRIVGRLWRHGDTCSEIAEREGVSSARIHQINDRAITLMRDHVTAGRRPWQPDAPYRPPPKTFTFDKAAFLAHMRGLKQFQARREQELIDTEREILDGMLARERNEHGGAKQPTPPQLPGNSLKIKLPVSYSVGGSSIATAKNPTDYTAIGWQGTEYYPPKPKKLGPYELAYLAETALRHFLALRRPLYAGLPWLGKWATRVTMPFPEGVIATAVDALHRDMPADAQLSACPFVVPLEAATPPNMVSANATNPHASLRISQSTDAATLFLDVTWDDA